MASKRVYMPWYHAHRGWKYTEHEDDRLHWSRRPPRPPHTQHCLLDGGGAATGCCETWSRRHCRFGAGDTEEVEWVVVVVVRVVVVAVVVRVGVQAEAELLE